MRFDAIGPKDMARRRGWTVKYVYDLLAAGRIPGATKIGKRWSIPAKALQYFDRSQPPGETQPPVNRTSANQ